MGRKSLFYLVKIKMTDKKKLFHIIEQSLDNTDKFLVDIKISPANHIEIIIDGDNNVTIEDCIALSRHVESSLDRDTEDFSLVVSSAGLDRPLTKPRQYQKNIGNPIKVKTTDNKNIKGTLEKFTQEHITVFVSGNSNTSKHHTEPKHIQIPFSNIKETKVEIMFNK